jgi:hypothetical protein
MKFPNPFRFISSMFFSLWGKLRGFDVMVPGDIYVERLETCRNCEYLIRGWEDQCSECTCFVDAKALLALEECPRRKWLRIWVKNDTVIE